ncbi:MAG: hypothetical protein V4444_11250 [Pseudomonadota bacterium]
MIFTLASLAVIILAITVVRWVASVPLLRTLSISVDQWADSVQGQDSGPLR